MRRAAALSIRALSLAAAFAAAGPAFAGLVITGNFNDAAMSGAGLSAAQIANVHTAFNAAASQFTTRFSDSIHVNIDVTAVAGTGTLGQSNTSIFRNGTGAASWAALQGAAVADKKSADDVTSVGAGGSLTAADPIGAAAAAHNWWYTRAQGKALGLTADDLSTDGTFTFGAGFNYDYDPTDGVGAGQFDFQGVAMHEISEIMGRIGISGGSIGGTAGYTLLDAMSYKSAGTRGLGGGPGNFFSIDNGSTMLYGFNGLGGGDTRDWASGGNDTFNAFSSPGVVNAFTGVDAREMDVLGYDLVRGTNELPEPGSVALLGLALAGLAVQRRRAK